MNHIDTAPVPTRLALAVLNAAPGSMEAFVLIPRRTPVAPATVRIRLISPSKIFKVFRRFIQPRAAQHLANWRDACLRASCICAGAVLAFGLIVRNFKI